MTYGIPSVKLRCFTWSCYYVCMPISLKGETDVLLHLVFLLDVLYSVQFYL